MEDTFFNVVSLMHRHLWLVFNLSCSSRPGVTHPDAYLVSSSLPTYTIVYYLAQVCSTNQKLSVKGWLENMAGFLLTNYKDGRQSNF